MSVPDTLTLTGQKHIYRTDSGKRIEIHVKLDDPRKVDMYLYDWHKQLCTWRSRAHEVFTEVEEASEMLLEWSKK